ncbi:hypothetical protein D3C78_1732910 [compost metagenome]
MRSSAALVTTAGCAGSLSSVTLNSPVGCSIDTVTLPAGGSACPAGNWTRPSHTVPGIFTAVPTVTAASTPMASWQTWGMKLRVVSAPPCSGGAISVILG